MLCIKPKLLATSHAKIVFCTAQHINTPERRPSGRYRHGLRLLKVDTVSHHRHATCDCIQPLYHADSRRSDSPPLSAMISLTENCPLRRPLAQ